ncbi:glycoside hydrolase family 3 protein [Microscilla marina]|uniref:beta-N-acetylhexosaminidase n=1 Tax=Microscilla marina ATCC 23134 TaxID=313606 RepID=A1ZDA7_MICM2|nr:glycoside hydrolase family 3 protein [Microscilla marina]EAY31646.1 glycosyl hydrolase, family 3 [Microscilla marina ATCC 23134]
MKKHIYSTTFLLLMLGASWLIYACRTPESRTQTNTAKLDSLDYKIGQMLMVGFRGTSIKGKSHIKRDIRKHHLGGVILYSRDLLMGAKPRNIVSKSQLKTLITDLKKLSDVPLLVAVDEEGGKVSRLNAKFGFATTQTPQEIGEINDLVATEKWATHIAQKVKAMGFNVNFAPVTDLNVNPKAPIIGKLGRSFSGDVNTLVQHALKFTEVHQKHGIVCAIKHFPGHGSAIMDSHLGFTDVTTTWKPIELKPFKQMIEQGFDGMVMTAHVFNKKLDAKYPATLSKKIMNDYLRKKWGWQGIIISDDMQMNAIAKNFGIEEALEKSINAGVDIVLFSNNGRIFYNKNIVPEAINIIKKLIKQGKISRKRIDESYQRIKKMKQGLK